MSRGHRREEDEGAENGETQFETDAQQSSSRYQKEPKESTINWSK